LTAYHFGECQVNFAAQQNVKPWVDSTVCMAQPKSQIHDYPWHVIDTPCGYSPVEVNDLRWEPAESKNNDDDDEHSNHSSFSYFPLLLLINTQVLTGSLAKPNFVSGFSVQEGNDNQGNEVRYGKKVDEKTANGPRLIS